MSNSSQTSGCKSMPLKLIISLTVCMQPHRLRKTLSPVLRVTMAWTFPLTFLPVFERWSSKIHASREIQFCNRSIHTFCFGRLITTAAWKKYSPEAGAVKTPVRGLYPLPIFKITLSKTRLFESSSIVSLLHLAWNATVVLKFSAGSENQMVIKDHAQKVISWTSLDMLNKHIKKTRLYFSSVSLPSLTYPMAAFPNKLLSWETILHCPLSVHEQVNTTQYWLNTFSLTIKLC